HFIIAEPIAEIQQPEKAGDRDVDQPVNIAHEVAVFYPAIKATLDRFNIHEFRVRRAGLTLQNNQNNISIRFIDLIINEWNMRDLDERADLHLSADEQEIKLNQSRIGFSEVSFDYQTGDLKIEDYVFDQSDSTGRPVISVKGASVVISDLDYDALMEEKYVLREMLIENPQVIAHIYPHEKNTNASRQPISDLLKKNLGELRISSGQIQNAQLDLYSYSEKDTFLVHLPRLDFTTHNFLVTEDSSTLMMEDLKLDIARTRLELGNGLGISFEQLTYNKYYDAAVVDLKITNQSGESNLLEADEIDLYRFNIFDYIYNSDLTADSVILRGGKISLDEELPINSGNKSQESRSATQFHLGKIELNDIHFHYNQGGRRIEARNLTAHAEDIIKEDSLNLQLQFLKSRSVTFRDNNAHINAQIDGVIFQPQLLAAEKVTAGLQDLQIDLAGLKAYPDGFDPTSPALDHWTDIEILKLDITGAIPKNNSTEKESTKNGRIIQIDGFRIDDINISLNLNDSTSVETKNAQLSFSDLRLGKGIPSFQEARFTTGGIEYESPSARIQTGAISIDNLSPSVVENLNVNLPDKSAVSVEQLMIHNPQAEDSLLRIGKLRLSDIQLNQSNSSFNSHADSLILTDAVIHMEKAPFVSELFVHGTRITIDPDADTVSVDIPKNNNPSGSEPLDLSKLFGKATIYPGSYALRDLIVTYELINISTAPATKHLNIQNLEFETKTSNFAIGRIETHDTDLHISNIKIDPKKSYSPEFESDIIAGEIPLLLFHRVSWENLFESNNFIASTLEIKDFEMTIMKDKTLPDPPPQTKPHLLTQLIPESENFNIDEIISNNGKLIYKEIGEKTGKEGHVMLDSVDFTMSLRNPLHVPEKVLEGHARLYGQGQLFFNYARLDSQQFDLEIRLIDFPTDSLNLMADPLEAISITSGFIHEFDLTVRADSISATGRALMSYEDLHIEIFKS
ncbi:MAG: hypothetical protein P8X57_06320, partial [Cyclobacteriaceae bacterium]